MLLRGDAETISSHVFRKPSYNINVLELLYTEKV